MNSEALKGTKIPLSVNWGSNIIFKFIPYTHSLQFLILGILNMCRRLTKGSVTLMVLDDQLKVHMCKTRQNPMQS